MFFLPKGRLQRSLKTATGTKGNVNSSRSHTGGRGDSPRSPPIQPPSHPDTGAALPGCAQRQTSHCRCELAAVARPAGITMAAQLHPPGRSANFVPTSFVDRGIDRDGIREGSDHIPSRACVRRLRRVVPPRFHACSFPARYRAVHRDARRGTRCREGESVVPLTEPPHSPPSDDARAAERSCRLFFSPR